jgi:ATP-dependent HslUV protease subunit HslV
MASDSNCSSGGVRIYSVRKIFRLQDGSLVGFAGDLSEGMKLIDWLDDGGDRETRPGLQNVHGLVVRPSGRITLYEAGIAISPRRPKYIAIGTGQAAAMGAMFHGANAVGAVRAAIEHDDHTRGPIVSMRLKR